MKMNEYRVTKMEGASKKYTEGKLTVGMVSFSMTDCHPAAIDSDDGISDSADRLQDVKLMTRFIVPIYMHM
jgi:hypothetical protein